VFCEEAAVDALIWSGGVLSAALLAYLFVSLLFPEKLP
jgi:K+-transporting ATPase KdpF subunit